MKFIDELSRLKQTVGALDWQRRNLDTGKLDPAQDRPSSLVFRELDPGRGGSILVGSVVDSLPTANWYRVQVEKIGILPCCFLMNSSAGPIGAKQISQISPGNVVLLWHSFKWPYGVIFGSVPTNILAGATPDFVSIQSRCGAGVDGPYRTFLSGTMPVEVVDWSSFRPKDSLIGDLGVITETGTGWFIDQMMSVFRAGENCGLWAFWDGYLRLASRHLDSRSDAARYESWNDQNELATLLGESVYDWEMMGAWEKDTTIYQATTTDNNPNPGPGKAPLEPLFEDQDQFHRWQEFGSYLGHARHEFLSLPPQSPNTSVSRLSVPLVLPGVYEEALHLDGQKTFASAKGIILSKRTAIPVPKRVKLPPDEAGDTPTNYLFAGAYGAGPAHTHVDDLGTTGANSATMTRLTGVDDRHTYLFELSGRLPFRKHARDWYMPDESHAELLGGVIQTKIPFTQLLGAPYITPPDPSTLTVDHNHSAKYWANNSWIELSPDGGISICDGFGSEIRMGGGNIYLTCPGNVFLQPGRDIVELAGHDHIIRAHNCADVSTTKGSIRVRAQDKLLMRGKNEVDIYSDGDIINKCVAGTFTVWSGDTYIRSGANNGVGDSSTSGMITLDASRGSGMLVTFADTVENFIVTAKFDYFSDLNGTVDAANYYGRNGSVIAGNLSVDGCITADGNIYADGWLIAVDGHVATSAAATYNNFVATLSGGDLTGAQNIISVADTAEADAITEGGTSYSNNLATCSYDAGQHGNTTVITNNKFTFRGDGDYMVTGFSLYESRWQQLARVNGDGVYAWVEEAESGTYPYPGASAWSTDTSFYRVDCSLFDQTSGRSEPTGGENTAAIYADPVYGSLPGVVPDGNYLILDANGAASPYSS